MELPELTDKQNKFLQRYFINGKNASEAYRYAYDTNASASTIWSEASKLLKNPNVATWVEYHNKNIQEFAAKDMIYTVQECMEEIKESQLMAVQSRDKLGNPNVSAFQKGIELKGKLFGLFKENLDLNANTTVTMNDITIGDQKMNFKIGTENDNSDIKNEHSIDTTSDAELATEDVANDNGVQ